MKEKASVVFRRLPSGEVIGEIVDSEGVTAESRSFGLMTEDEFRTISELIRAEFPGCPSPGLIELAEN